MHAKNVHTLGYLQMDVKVVTPELSGLPWTCFKYAVIDIYSRWKDAVILNQLDQNGAMVALLEILPRLPFKPVFIQTDNGLEFQKRFHDMVVSMGLQHHFIHKSTPNENAVIERSFRTDEEEFYFRLPKRPKHYDELRDQYQDYLHYYNHERIHLGIGLKTPAQIVAYVLGD
jgi:transposase InsO family protein